MMPLVALPYRVEEVENEVVEAGTVVGRALRPEPTSNKEPRSFDGRG